MSKTIRLIAPDWQGGNKPEYYFGAELLSWLAPNNDQQKEIKLDVQKPDHEKLERENNVVAQSSVKRNVNIAARAIENEAPERIITFGGNCLVSQAPFDYLHGQYGDKLGVVWIDSHPDISTPKIYDHEHAMVLGNLLGDGDPELSQDVKHPFDANSFLFVGLQEPNQEEIDKLNDLNLNYTIQKQASLNIEEIQEWIRKNGFTKIAVHLDLDVLDPKLFRSLYFAEPSVTEFPSESGTMAPRELMNILPELFKENDIVGLTVAEYMPWDAIQLKNMLSGLDIFR